MDRTFVQGRVESWVAKLAWVPRRPVVAGAFSGVVAGIALGTYTGPIGVVFGMWLGVAVGIVTGYVLAREDATKSVRTRELDTIIGITKGTMGRGAPPVAVDAIDEEEDAPAYSSKEAWLSEWLTPPPPVAR